MYGCKRFGQDVVVYFAHHSGYLSATIWTPFFLQNIKKADLWNCSEFLSRWILSYFSLHHQRYLLRTEHFYVSMNIHIWHSPVGVGIWCEQVAFDSLWIFTSTCLNVGPVIGTMRLQFQVKGQHQAPLMHWSAVDYMQFSPLISILLMCRYQVLAQQKRIVIVSIFIGSATKRPVLFDLRSQLFKTSQG